MRRNPTRRGTGAQRSVGRGPAGRTPQSRLPSIVVVVRDGHAPAMSLDERVPRLRFRWCGSAVAAAFGRMIHHDPLSTNLPQGGQEWLFALRTVATNTAALTSAGAAITPMSTSGSP